MCYAMPDYETSKVIRKKVLLFLPKNIIQEIRNASSHQRYSWPAHTTLPQRLCFSPDSRRHVSQGVCGGGERLVLPSGLEFIWVIVSQFKPCLFLAPPAGEVVSTALLSTFCNWPCDVIDWAIETKLVHLFREMSSLSTTCFLSLVDLWFIE